MDSAELRPATSGFALAAAITSLVNTALSCAKDANAPLKAFLKGIAGHDWTTQGLFDLVLFVVLGLTFANIKSAARMDPNRLIASLIGAVIIAAMGLTLWFAFT
jgi:hypothetical protein